MIKTAIIGCGKIADAHAAEIQRLKDCTIVAACDHEPLMAQQLCERFGIDRPFTDVAEMLQRMKPDVVHITTPPASHYPLAKQCLEAGTHVYLEKPFALDSKSTKSLLDLSNAHGRKMTAGHDLQFSNDMQRMRKHVDRGYLGAGPVHLESYYCYDLSSPTYAKALLSDKNHWVRSLPGKLLHNIISHGVARIAEFLDPNASLVVLASGGVSPVLRSFGEKEIIDELRVNIRSGDTSAYFTFSSQMQPSLNQFRIYGTKNGLIVDEDNQTVIKHSGKRYKSYAERFIPPLGFAKQYTGNFFANISSFLRNDFHMKTGMKYLIERFYESIRHDGQLPISYGEIQLTSDIMDSIFQQLSTADIQEYDSKTRPSQFESDPIRDD